MKPFLFSLVATIFLFSCKVVNNVTFEKDNSGELSVFINMGGFVDKTGGNMPDRTKRDVDFSAKKNPNLDSITLVEYLTQINGITEVKGITNEQEYKFGLKFKFNSPKSLNKAVNRIGHFMKIEKDSTALLGNFDYYTFTKRSLEVKEPLQGKSPDQSEDEFTKEAEKMAKMLTMEWGIDLKGRKVKKTQSDLEIEKEGNSKVIVSLPGDKLTTRTSERIVLIRFK